MEDKDGSRGAALDTVMATNQVVAISVATNRALALVVHTLVAFLKVVTMVVILN